MFKSKGADTAGATAKLKEKFSFSTNQSTLKEALGMVALERGPDYEVPEARKLVVVVLE